MNKISNKRTFFLILLFFFLSIVGFSQFSSISIIGKNVNMREEPTTTAKVLQKLETPDVGSLIEKGKLEKIGGQEDYWYKIKWNNKVGWVFGAFTNLAQGPFKIEGKYEDCWFSDQTGDGGCKYILEINRKDKTLVATITQGYPDTTEGQLFPEQNIQDLKVNENTGEISFKFNFCSKVDYSEEKPKETWITATAKGIVRCKAITLEIESNNSYNDLVVLIRNIN